MEKYFDLNIDRILENWDISHAVRELIANAIDESILTNSEHPVVQKSSPGCWFIRDFGRGLNYQCLMQCENPEKLNSTDVIGKFGIGLKDALATFDRNKIKVLIRSSFGDITLDRTSKHSFDDVITLHAIVNPPSDPNLVGTVCELSGINDSEVEAAKQMFLHFSNVEPLEITKYGEVYPRFGNSGEIYINGLRVASEPNFLFSYNITSLDSKIKKALNRERQNLGRVAYSDRVKSILLNCTSESVLDVLAEDLQFISFGESHEELSWSDIQNFAVKVLNSQEKVFFVGSRQLVDNPLYSDIASSDGFRIIAIPDKLAKNISGSLDISGQSIVDVNQLLKCHNDSFQYSWVQVDELTESELEVWNLRKKILELFGGTPNNVMEIRISETMQPNYIFGDKTLGLWDPDNQWIIIHRSQLTSLAQFAGTLLHEAIHAKYGVNDISREFELHLTELIGRLVAELYAVKPTLKKFIKGIFFN